MNINDTLLSIKAEDVKRGQIMSKYRVVVWCESCRGDDEGCFHGEAEVLGDSYQSWEDASKAGSQYCGELPYRYRVEQDDPY